MTDTWMGKRAPKLTHYYDAWAYHPVTGKPPSLWRRLLMWWRND